MPAVAPPTAPRVSLCAGWPSRASGCELALEHLGIIAPALEPLARHVARVDVFDAVAQRLDDRRGQRRRRELGWRQVLVPFVVDRPGEHVDHPDAGAAQLGALALR